MSELNKPLVVVKIGSSSIVKSGSDGTEIDSHKIIALCQSIKELRDSGYRVVLVSSGAVAAGAHVLNIPRPKNTDVDTLSACAAIGQPQLMSAYSVAANKLGYVVGQVLLLRNDFHRPESMEMLESTLNTLFELGVVPILNENDVVSNAELSFGDNDGIAALIAILLRASKFVLLTDQDGLLDKDPNRFDDAKLIETIDKFESSMVDNEAALSTFGSGGAGTKVAAADLASYCVEDLDVFIANSNKAGNLEGVISGEEISTKIKVNKAKNTSADKAYEIFSVVANANLEKAPYIPVADLFSL